MSERPRLLAVTPTAVWPVGDGISLRIHHLLVELGAWWRIVLVADGAGERPPGGVALDDYVPVALTGAWRSLPSQYDPAPLARAVRDAARGRRPDAVLLWAGAEFLAWEGAGFEPRVVADRIDCAALTAWRGMRTQRGMRATARSVRAAAEYAVYERRVVRRTDATVLVGESDAAALGWLSGRRRAIHVIGNGVMVGEAGAARRSVPTVVFTGTLNYEPNVTAVVHLVGDIWPTVRSAVPDAALIVAGRNPAAELVVLDGVEGVSVRANVDRMQDIFDCAWVAAAPMRSGSGVKNKVLEAWAAGLPAVLSTTATNGLAMPPGHEALVADDPAAFAAVLVRLLRTPDESARLGAAARSFVTGRYTWRAAAARLSRLLGEPGGGS